MRYLPVFFALCALAPCWAGSVYKSVGPDGKVIYSDTPPVLGSVDVSKDLRARDPGLKVDPVKVAMNVYIKEVIVETAYRFCKEQVPQSEASVRAARDRWMQRHAQLRAKKIQMLQDRLSSEELRRIGRRE